nr:hypothetical protein [Tanacetum cinerariifolium]
MMDFESYKTYYAIAIGAEPPKPKKIKKKSDSAISSEETPSKKKPAKAKKDVPSTKKQTTKPKPIKKKVQIKADRGKGDGTVFESEVPDKQQNRISGTDEGTGTKLGVSDVPKYDSKSEKESWGDSGEEDDEDESNDDKSNDDDGDNDNNDDDDDDEADNDRTKVYAPPEFVPIDVEEKVDDEEKIDEEEDDDITKELYKDVNVNLGNKYDDMTDTDQGGADQHNVSQESRFEHVDEDAHVTLTAVHDTQKIEGLMQSYSVSSNFTYKLLNFENASPANNVIASLMDIIVHHEETSSHTSSLYIVPVTNKRKHVDFRPPQTWIIDTSRTEKPPTSFDELMDTLIEFSSFVMNRLNISNLTQELLVGSAFNLLKGTCKSHTELEYHFEECYKAITERLDWHNPEGKQYPFDLHKPLLLIPNHRGRQVIPQDYFINNDLEYPKGGSLSRKYSTSVTKTKAVTYEVKWIEDKRVKDLQLGVESYQKKLNLSKPDTYRSDLSKLTTYTAYSDSQGVIYEDKFKRNRLMRTDELHKFSDGTLLFFRDALQDIAFGNEM